MHEREHTSWVIKESDDVIIGWCWRVVRVRFDCKMAGDKGTMISVRMEGDPTNGRDWWRSINGSGGDNQGLIAKRLDGLWILK